MRFAILLLAACSLRAEDINPERYLGDVKYLTSPELSGRGIGTSGLDKAADYVEAQLRAAGLKPPPGAGYGQPFAVTLSAKLVGRNRFNVSEAGRKRTLTLGQDFVPLAFSSSGKLTGRMVFAGYGITAPEYGYDDYAGIDARGKVVIVLQHEPQETDKRSVFDGNRLTRHATFGTKLANAKKHGATGVILLNDVRVHPKNGDKVGRFGWSVGSDAGLPFVQVRSAEAEHWMKEAGQDLGKLTGAIDKDLKPRSFELPASTELDAEIAIEREDRPVRNVQAYLPGETDEYLIIGAHYDHLGMGGRFSLAPGKTGKLHPGADDNASGVAGILELARWFASQPKQKRGVLFLAFTAEEMGVLGSLYWVDHPALPLGKAVAMINLDMIGRVRGGKVYTGSAVKASAALGRLVTDNLAGRQLKIGYLDGPKGAASDHRSFADRGIPSIMFFTGFHSDYHTPSDTWEKVDPARTCELLRSIAGIAAALTAGKSPR